MIVSTHFPLSEFCTVWLQHIFPLPWTENFWSLLWKKRAHPDRAFSPIKISLQRV